MSYCNCTVTKIKNLKASVLLLHSLTLKLKTKATKTKQCSKQTCLQIIVLLNITKATKTKQCSKQTCLEVIVLLNITTSSSMEKMVNK